MSTAKGVRWQRWVGAIAGVLVLFKSVSYVLRKLLRLAKSEAQARGSDVGFVLGLAERRKTGRV